MKTKFKSLFIILAALVVSAVCFAACADNAPPVPVHVHTFSSAWAHDENSHWHPADCAHTAERDGEASHDFSNGACVCGYEVDFDEWQHDDVKHWHNASFDGVAERNGEALHVLENNKCVCGVGAELTYRFAVDVYTVTGYTGEFPAGATLTIPEKYNGCKVIAISDGAFEGDGKIEKVVLPSDLRTVGESAFAGCESVREINLENVTDIGNSAFEGCKNLKRVTTSRALQTLGEQAFCDCERLEEADIGGSIKQIGRNAFLRCKSLRSVTIPQSVKKILSQAFARCVALQTVTLPAKLEFIGMSAFRGSGITQIELPDTVSTLGSYAFTDCKALTKAALSAAIRYSVDDWFGGCSALEEVTVPYVGSRYYKEGTDYVESGAAVKHFGYIFGTDEQSEELFSAVTQNGKTYYLPKSLSKVTVVGGTVAADAFAGCNISEIVLGDGVTDLRGQE